MEPWFAMIIALLETKILLKMIYAIRFALNSLKKAFIKGWNITGKMPSKPLIKAEMSLWLSAVGSQSWTFLSLVYIPIFSVIFNENCQIMQKFFYR